MKAFVIFSSAVIISFFFLPLQSAFKYSYQENKFWQYPDLYAEFGFPLLKSTESIENEKNEILNNFTPYYFLNKDSLQSFSTKYYNYILRIEESQDLKINNEEKNEFHDLGLSLIKRIYDTGIILDNESNQNFNIVEQNSIVLRDRSSFFTESSAITFFLDYLKNSNLKNSEILAPFLENLIHPNVVLDSSLSNIALEEKLNQILPFKGVVEKGELIVSKGEPINKIVLQKLDSLKFYYRNQEISSNQLIFTIIGFFLLSGIVLIIYFIYLQKLFPEIVQSWSSLVFIIMWFPILGAMLYISTNINNWSVYLVPFAISPVIIKNFFNSRLAFFTHIVNLILCSFLISPGFEFSFTQIIAGTLVILVINDSYNWNVYLKSIFIIFIGYSLSFLGLNFLKGVPLLQIDFTFFKWIGLNSFFTLMAFPLIPILEKIFGFVSTGKLNELQDFNHPLLIDLSSKAPGTFQHSIQVSLLAEAAARKIGCNALLVKTGALYHDIGKTIQPDFFIENINPRNSNPHDKINPIQSATHIIDHVNQGILLGKKYKLPKVILDFIETHHGTSLVNYFFHKANKLSQEPIDEKQFRYPGPLPFTKEQTILMIADSLEAASRTLSNINGDTIELFVDKIIDHKNSEGQFYYSNLTFSELSTIKQIFCEKLKSMNHQRIEYPSS